MKLLFVLSLTAVAGQDARSIMEKVAANMESSAGERQKFVYGQDVFVRMLRTDGQVARQERRTYTAVPGPDRTEKELVKLEGEHHKSKTEIIRYTGADYKKDGMDIDREMIKGLVKELIANGESRDGIPHSLFPMRKSDLPRYRFQYLGQDVHRGREVHRIGFEPLSKKECRALGERGEDDCPAHWKGEALVDAGEFQPVRIATDLNFKMPWAVKAFLGTNLRQTGFSVSYRRVAENVWFPETYGTEFRLDLLFGYKRVITMSMDSKDFRKTDAGSTIRYEETGAGANP